MIKYVSEFPIVGVQFFFTLSILRYLLGILFISISIFIKILLENSIRTRILNTIVSL